MKTRFDSMPRTDEPDKQGESHKRRKVFWLSVALVGVGLLIVGVSVSLAEIQSLFSRPPASFGVEQAQMLPTTEPTPLSEEKELPSTGEDAQPTDDSASETVIDDEVEQPTPTVVLTEGATSEADLSEALPTEMATEEMPAATATEAMPTATPPATATPEPTATPLPPTPTPVPPTPTPRPGPPTRIVAPSIGLDTKVVEVGWTLQEQGGNTYKVWTVADYAAGWHNESSRPGEAGNMVVTGHNNMRGEVFRNVVDLGPGDEIIIYVGDQAYTYAVESRLLLLEKGASAEDRAHNARWIGEFPDERVTIITCWPYTGNSHRVVVIAKPK